MDPTLQDVLARLDRVSGQVEELRDGVRQAVAIADLDPDMALTRARKVLEFIIRDVFRRHTGEEPGTRPLENMLQRLVKDGYFPKRLSAYANAVRELGNVGTHGYGEGVTTADVAQSLTHLTVILEWYFEHERPAEAQGTAALLDTPAADPAVAKVSAGDKAAAVRTAATGTRASRRVGWLIGLVVLVTGGVVAGGAFLLFLPGPAPSTPLRKPAPWTDTGTLQPPRYYYRWAPPSQLDCTGDKGLSAADMKRAQTAWAKYLGRQVEEEDEIAPGVGMKFVLVPPGKFLMGSPESEQEREKNEVQHEVELTRPFYLAVNDVTQAQYEAVTGQNPSNLKGPDLPVETVSWTEADDFARKLTQNAKGGLLYRLPTEAEWEYSCRGGRPSSLPFGIGDGTSFSSLQANFDSKSTTPVGKYEANALGLYDMQGNVWQWCADYYGDYPTEKVTNPKGPATGLSRVSRGGSWFSYARGCRAADRGRDAPGIRNGYLGFRLARVPSGLDK